MNLETELGVTGARFVLGRALRIAEDRVLGVTELCAALYDTYQRKVFDSKLTALKNAVADSIGMAKNAGFSQKSRQAHLKRLNELSPELQRYESKVQKVLKRVNARVARRNAHKKSS